jgi:probable phosphomutase (TIGR03848 family)
MTVFLLVRHGLNDMVGVKLAGRLPGVHLNAKGKAQARRLAAEIAGLPIKAVISSPLERAQETAEPIARIHNLPVEINEGLLEIDFGNWQGKSLKQLRRRKLWKDVQEHPSTFCFPEGETFADAQSRITGTLQALSKTFTEKDIVVCVGHSDSIRLAVAYFLGMPLDAFQRLRIDPASVTTLYLNDAKAYFGAINAGHNFPEPNL